MAESLTAILSSPHPPACIHLHHPHHPPAYALPPLPSICIIARVDAVEHHTPRLLFSGVLRRVADQVGGEVEEVSSWDGFARGLREVWTGERKGKGSKVNGAGKGKGKEKMAVSVEDEEEGRVLVVAVTKAERLRRVMGEGWAVITRLAELVSQSRCIVNALQPLIGRLDYQLAWS
jgi:origin recognition complex subunit 5